MKVDSDTSAPHGGFPLVTGFVFALLPVAATGVCYANWQVNRDHSANFNNSPSFTLDGLWGNMVAAYADSIGTGKGQE